MSTRTFPIATTFRGLGVMALALLPLSAAAQADAGRPVTWNTYLGGGLAGGVSPPVASEELEGVIASRFGEVYVTGKTNAAGFPQSLDGTKPGADQDIVITRLSTDGGVMWSRVIGGPGEDVGKRIAFNHPDETHLLVAGSTASGALRDGGFPVYGSLTGSKSGFLLRVELDGRISWFTYLPDGGGNDEVQDLAIFPDGPHAYITGGSGNDAFLTKMNIPDAGPPSLAWAQRFGTSGSVDVAYTVAVHTDYTPQLLYVGGRTGVVTLTDTSVKNVLPAYPYGGGEFDGFLSRFNAQSGAMEWFRYIGGNRNDEVRDLLQQPTGGFTLMGNTLSTNYPPQEARTGQNIFLGRMVDTQGTVDQEKLVGAGGETLQGHAASDRYGNIYFGGSTVSPNALALRAFDWEFEGSGGGFGDDGFIAMADRNLQRIAWASYVGGSSSTSEVIRGVTMGPQGQLTFVGGTSAGAGVLVVNRGAYLSANGNIDGIIFRLPVDQRPPVTGAVQGRFTAGNKVTATWRGFRDDETDIEQFRVELLANGVLVETDDLPYNATTHTFETPTSTGLTYRVRVTATDLYERVSNPLTSDPVATEPPDGGGADGGMDGGGGTTDAGPEVPEEDDGPESPVGWSCGSAGGGSALGVVVLMLALPLLARRRAR